MTEKMVKLDKYAKDGRSWQLNAEMNFAAAQILFRHELKIMMCFPAATLGHHAIEAYLKSALIHAGSSIFDPSKLGQLSSSQKLDKSECAWGHDLVKLGEMLYSKQPAFDLDAVIVPYYLPYGMPITVRRGLEIFDPFFWELRYPGELDKCDGIGPDDVVILQRLVGMIKPFTPANPNRRTVCN